MMHVRVYQWRRLVTHTNKTHNVKTCACAQRSMLWAGLSPPMCSAFVLDAFKRVYSNEDIATKAIPFLWENFDKEGWSLWRADYKFNQELKMTFMASNLIGGMFQRLEKLHKYGFASVLIFGKDYNLTISGVWILRGQQLAFDVST